MAIGEQIEIMIGSLTGNNIPPELVTIKKSYSNNSADVIKSNNELLNGIKCSGLAVEGGNGLLVHRENAPFIILFEDARQTAQALGLGLFYIQDGDLFVELPNGIDNPFTITNGVLTVEIDGENNYTLENKELKYNREVLLWKNVLNAKNSNCTIICLVIVKNISNKPW